MASSKTNPPAPNLATILSIKRKMAAKNPGESGTKQLPPAPPAVINSHSNERIAFHQGIPEENPAVTAPTTVPENTDEQPKISRKTKQLEVGLLDKKMEEINRKQEVKTNEALDTWKGFDSFNYGFNSTPGASNTTPGPPVATKQRTPTPTPKNQPSIVEQQPPEKQSSHERVNSSVKDQPRSESPPQEKQTSPPQETVQKEPSPPPSSENKPVDKRRSSSPRPPPPHEEKPIEKQPSSLPPPTPRPSKVKTPEQERPKPVPHKSPTPVTENIIPISSITSDPQIFQNNAQPYEKSPLPISNGHPFKLFPDIKNYETRKPRHALKSIQRSMDRYRFHVW